MVLLERIELSTSPLPRECSTPELQQQPLRAVVPYDEEHVGIAKQVGLVKTERTCGIGISRPAQTGLACGSKNRTDVAQNKSRQCRHVLVEDLSKNQSDRGRVVAYRR